MTRLGSTDIDVFPLSLGGNVFGWTASEEESFAILDAYVAGGGNFIDTADVYARWVEGNSGGESEATIGRWMASRGNRDAMVIATKGGQDPALPGTSRAALRRAIEGSLERLGTDRIDLYYTHVDDQQTPLDETVAALGELVAAGTVRAVGASNFSAERLQASLDVARSLGVAAYEALQPNYNLVHRDEFEGPLRDVVASEHLSTVPYYGLASGFLTGKYRGDAAPEGPRAGGAGRHRGPRGDRVLAALDAVAAAHEAPVASVALAWLAAQPTVAAPIASARTVDQVGPLLRSVELELTADELGALDAASSDPSDGDLPGAG